MEAGDEELTRLRPVYAGVALLVAVVAIAGAAVWYLQSEIDPTRVVIVAEGCSDACRENVARRAAFLMEQRGFDVHTSDRALAAAMAEHDAIHGVEIALSQQTRTPLVEGTHSLEVVVQARSTTRGEAPREPSALALSREASTEDRALLEAGLAGVDALVAQMEVEILKSAAIARYVEAGANPHDLDRFEQIDRARAGVGDYERGKIRFAELCAEVAAELTADGTRCLTSSCGNEYLVDALDESSALLRVETAEPVFVLGSTSDVKRAEVPERYVVAHVDGTRREVLAAGNLFSSATLSADQRFLAYVEIASEGTAVLVRMDLEEGTRRVVHTVAAPARLFFPDISPNGRWIAFVHRAFPGAEATIYVADVEGGATWEPAEFAVETRWIELGDEPVLAVTIPAERNQVPTDADSGIDESEIADDLEDEPGIDVVREPTEDLPPLTHIALVRPEEDRGVVIARIGGVERHVGAVAGMRADDLWLTAATPTIGCELATWRPDGSLSFLPLDACVMFPSVGPDGALYGDAASERGDANVVRIDPATGAITHLIDHPLRERWARPVGTHERVRVFFDRIPERRYARHPVAGVCWTDVDLNGRSSPSETPVDGG